MAKKYILTGGPCAGKTTTLERLTALGYGAATEAAREIISEEQEKAAKDSGYKPVLPWVNLAEFQQLVAKRQKEKEMGIKGTAFLDRSLVDAIAYAEMAGTDVPISHYDLKDAGYGIVFFLEQLPYANDSGRQEDAEMAASIHRKIYETYERLGFSIINVPVMGIEDRIKFILKHLEEKECHEVEAKFSHDITSAKYSLDKYPMEWKESREKNYVLNIGEFLEGKGYMLRLRDNGSYIITLKGPDTGNNVTDRLEIEKKIPKSLFNALRKLMPEKAFYEKYRETYTPSYDAGCKICVDYVTGLGGFVEIEAKNEAAISLWKERLGIIGDAIRKPYYKMIKEKEAGRKK